jgi:hypothetical protein
VQIKLERKTFLKVCADKTGKNFLKVCSDKIGKKSTSSSIVGYKKIIFCHEKFILQKSILKMNFRIRSI